MEQEIAGLARRLEDLIVLTGYSLIGWILSTAIQSSLNPIARPPRELYQLAERALEILSRYRSDPELLRISQLLKLYRELGTRPGSI